MEIGKQDVDGSLHRVMAEPTMMRAVQAMLDREPEIC